MCFRIFQTITHHLCDVLLHLFSFFTFNKNCLEVHVLRIRNNLPTSHGCSCVAVAILILLCDALPQKVAANWLHTSRDLFSNHYCRQNAIPELFKYWLCKLEAIKTVSFHFITCFFTPRIKLFHDSIALNHFSSMSVQ